MNTNIFLYSLLILVHFEIFMIVWSMITTIVIDPGNPEIFWGFYLSNTENKRWKYCLICHIFKPERCHHCSKCGRCVLGMDHHCPWLFSCIGYYNRWYFMLTLLWSNITFITILIINIKTILNIINYFNKGKGIDNVLNWLDLLGLFIWYFLVLLIFITLLKFTYFHYKLIRNNNTTLETLDAERKNVKPIWDYDLGIKWNFDSVFGPKWYSYVFPITSAPMTSDGIVWMKKDNLFSESLIQDN